jgi:SOS-response transcriptional repressor LexA
MILHYWSKIQVLIKLFLLSESKVINIREKIGQRIRTARKIKGLTRKALAELALAELTEDLKQSRINGWERGARIPGPEEIKLLAKVLDVSASYLMCLSDDEQPEKISDLGVLIPILDHKQAVDSKAHIDAIQNQQNMDGVSFIPISAEIAKYLGKYTFALKIIDDSMEPELRVNDILIVNGDAEPKPGGLVIAKLEKEDTVIARRYKQLSNSNEEFILSAVNENWASIQAGKNSGHKVVGCVKGVLRLFS